MAKYIIDIPDSFVDIKNGLHIPMDKTGNFRIDTGITLTPYTEPDRKAIEDEVWEFVRIITDMTEKQRIECFGGKSCDLDEYWTYQDAKAKYEAWKKQKDEICVGDEVIYNSRTRAVVLKPETKEKYGTILTSEFDTIVVTHDELEKTGRHFPEIAELLKKMKEE